MSDGIARIDAPFATHRDAERILRNRDNINALFSEKHGFRLLTVREERSILVLFKNCDSEEAFAYHLQALAGLATSVNEREVGRVVSAQPETDGSINLLECLFAE